MGFPNTSLAAHALGRRGVHALAAAGVALVLSLVGAAAPAVADTDDGPEVTWGVHPAPGPDGEPRENYAYAIEPGQELSDAIVVANYDAAPLVLDVYAADAFTTSSGQLDAATREVSPRAVGAWVLPVADRITIEPGESVEVPFTLTVPENATPGDHAGAILTALTTPQVEDGVSVDRRLGIRIHVRVGGELVPTVAVEDLRVDYAGTFNPFGLGEATVSYTVRNTGNTRLSVPQSATVSGPFGVFAVEAADLASVPEILPGEEWPVTIRLSGVVPAFVLTASVALAPELPAETAATVAADPPAVEATARTAAIPWMLLALVLLVAAAIVLAVRRTRRRRARDRAREDARVREAVEEALRQRDDTTSMPVERADAPSAYDGPIDPSSSAEDVAASAGGQKTKS